MQNTFFFNCNFSHECVSDREGYKISSFSEINYYFGNSVYIIAVLQW